MDIKTIRESNDAALAAYDAAAAENQRLMEQRLQQERDTTTQLGETSRRLKGDRNE